MFVLTIILTTTAYSFDGKLKGVVLGGGIGLTPNAHWKMDYTPFPNDPVITEEDNVALGFNVIIGYAWDNQNMIAYEGNAAFYNSNTKTNSTHTFKFLNDPILQGFNGISWYYYYKDLEQSIFSMAGLGIYFFEGKGSNEPGIGLLIGGGYNLPGMFKAGFISEQERHRMPELILLIIILVFFRYYRFLAFTFSS